MSPNKQIVIGETKIEQYYWNGKSTVYVNNRLFGWTFDEAVTTARRSATKPDELGAS